MRARPRAPAVLGDERRLPGEQGREARRQQIRQPLEVAKLTASKRAGASPISLSATMKAETAGPSHGRAGWGMLLECDGIGMAAP